MTILFFSPVAIYFSPIPPLFCTFFLISSNFFSSKNHVAKLWKYCSFFSISVLLRFFLRHVGKKQDGGAEKKKRGNPNVGKKSPDEEEDEVKGPDVVVDVDALVQLSIQLPS